MSSAALSSGRTARIPFGRIVRAGAIAAVGAVLANVLVYFVASALGWMPATYINPQLGRPIGVGEVVGATLPGAVGATIVFALLARFTRRPVTIFRIVAVIVLVLSFLSPLALPGAPLSLILSLEIMHVVAAAVIVGVLTMRASAA
jgi:hypothetical protein